MRRQNGITIDDVLKMECMEKSKLIAGFNGRRNTVSRVNIMADPDIIDWVDEGELLLTTAYSFKKDNIEVQKKLIRECAKKNLAGIGIKIYPYLERLSDEVIELANELNFPIIDIYYGTAFSDIMTPVFKEIFNKQASLLQRLEKVHEQLMNVVLSGGSFKEIGRVVYENLKNPTLIKIFFPDQCFLEMGSLEENLKNALLENAQGFYDPMSIKGKEKKFHESTEMIHGKLFRRMVMPIIVHDRVYGHLLAWNVDTPLGGFDLSVLEAASTTIALEILKQLSIRDVENRYRYEFLEDLLSSEEKRRQKAVERAGNFKLGIYDHYIIAVIQLYIGEDSQVDNLQQNIFIVNDITEKVIEELGLKAFIVSKTDSTYVLLSFSSNSRVNSHLKSFSTKLSQLLSSKLKKAKFKIGIGRCYKGLYQVNQSYKDALKAVSTSDILDIHPVVYFEDLGIYKILCQDYLKEELEKFYDGTIKPLVEYDNKKSTELIKTLEVYFQYNGNLKKISDALFTHYNTTLYRIRRIQKITRMNLEDSQDRLNLEIALKIKNILRK